MSRTLALLFLATGLTACGGGGDQPERVKNDAQRQADQLNKQAESITKQTENGTAAIEQALENESAITFENRGNLLNEAAPAAEAPANSAR